MTTTSGIDPPRGLARSSVTIAAGTLTSRVTGLVRVAVTLAVLGGTRLTDVYNAANTTPNIVYELLLGGVLTASLMPLFVKADAEHDDGATASIFTFALAGLLLLTALAVLAAPVVAHLFTANAPVKVRADAHAVGTLLVVMFMPQMLFYGFTALATAALNARRRFVAAAYAPALNNVVVVALMLTIHDRLVSCPASSGSSCSLRYAHAHESLVVVLGIGTTAGIATMAVALVPALRRAGIHVFTIGAVWRHPAVHRLIRLSGWTVGYVVTNQLALAFILWITPDKGSALTQYQSAFIFFQLPHGLIAVSIMTAIVPEFARAANRGDIDALRHHFRLGLRWLLLTITPAAAGYLVLARPIIETVLGHGRFNTASAVSGTAHALAGFAVGLVAFSVYLYTLRIYYAQGDTRTPFFVNAAENAINIVAAAVLFPLWGVGGLGLAYSVAYGITALVVLIVLHRSIGGVLDGAVAATFARAVAAAVLAAGAAWLAVHELGSSAAGLAAACGAGILTYGVALVLLRDPTITAGITTIRRRYAARM